MANETTARKSQWGAALENATTPRVEVKYVEEGHCDGAACNEDGKTPEPGPCVEISFPGQRSPATFRCRRCWLGVRSPLADTGYEIEVTQAAALFLGKALKPA